MYTSLKVADTQGLDSNQRELVTDLDAEVCTREMLGILITMMQEISAPNVRSIDFVTRGRQVFTFLREHGIDFFDGMDFTHWSNAGWIGALGQLRTLEHDIDSGMIPSGHPHLDYVGKPFVPGEIAESAGMDQNILPLLQDEVPEFDFDARTLDVRSRIAKLGDYLHLTAHPLLTAQHPTYTRFVRNQLVPKAEEVIAASVAAESNQMMKKWASICASRRSFGVHATKEIFFQQLAGMRADRDQLFRVVRSVDTHVTNERVMNPTVRAHDVEGVVSAIQEALHGAWKRKHQAGRMLDELQAQIDDKNRLQK